MKAFIRSAIDNAPRREKKRHRPHRRSSISAHEISLKCAQRGCRLCQDRIRRRNSFLDLRFYRPEISPPSSWPAFAAAVEELYRLHQQPKWETLPEE